VLRLQIASEAAVLVLADPVVLLVEVVLLRPDVPPLVLPLTDVLLAGPVGEADVPTGPNALSLAACESLEPSGMSADRVSASASSGVLALRRRCTQLLSMGGRD
jgi:hypothetical protein